MKYDDLLTNYVGEFGRYQKFQLALVCLPVMMTAMQMLSWTFAAAGLDHRLRYGSCTVVMAIWNPSYNCWIWLTGHFSYFSGHKHGACRSNYMILVMFLGQVVLGAIAYGVRDFQTLMLVISLPYFYVVFIPYIWLVPESARWLMSQGRYDEANEILMKAAKCNGRELPDDVIKQVDTDVKQQSGKKYGFFDLFRFSGLRKRTLLSYYCWFRCLTTNRVARIDVSGVYCGISMNPKVYGGDRYVTFILAGAAEFPAILLSCLFVNRLGRKLLPVVWFSLTAFFMFITLALDEENTNILTASVILAKSSIFMTYAIIYVFTPGLYPTVLRNTATGSCSMVARVGVISASYVAMYLIEYSRIAVVLIFGSFSVSAAIVVIIQPETSGLKLLETVEEAKQIGIHGNIVSFKPQHPQTSLKTDIEPDHDE